MKLLANRTTPFGRKVIMTAKIKGVWPMIELVEVDPNAPHAAELEAANPLGKIPALILADGAAIFDGAVIAEYLDRLAPAPRLFPEGGAARWHVLTEAALADGLIEAAVLIVYEHRFREPAWRSDLWINKQQAKVDTALSHLEQHLPPWRGDLDIGKVSVAAALGYLDLRQAGRWRAGQPRLAAWLDCFSRDVPAYRETAPPGA